VARNKHFEYTTDGIHFMQRARDQYDPLVLYAFALTRLKVASGNTMFIDEQPTQAVTRGSRHMKASAR
jgi:hypothetical protein